MSNLSRIQNNNASLDACIEKANALPDAGSGGASVETCTVTLSLSTSLSGNTAMLLSYGCMQLIDGVISCITGIVTSTKSVVIENVIQGSLCAITLVNTSIKNYYISSFNIDNMLDLDYDDTYLYLRAYDYGGNECSCVVYVES